MFAQEVAKKYARALMLSVTEKNMVDRAQTQFVGLQPLVTEDDKLLNFLTAPQIPEERKTDLVHSVFGDHIDKLFVEFLLVLVDKHRINYLPEIIEEFERLVKAEKGILAATAITAIPIDQSEREKLMAKLAAKSSMKIELEEKVDPSIIGGMIVILHNEIIDGSIRYQLEQINDSLASVRVH